MRSLRSTVSMIRRIDALYMAPGGETGSDHVPADILGRIVAIYDMVIEHLETNQNALEPCLDRIVRPIEGVVKVLKRLPLSEARLVAKDSRDLINAIIGAMEANRDLTLALRLIRTRVEVLVTGRGKPAANADEVRKFLAES